MNTLSPQDRAATNLDSLVPAYKTSEPLCTVWLCAVMMVQLMACGGSSPKANPYDKAIGKQESCCAGLQDTGMREQCEQSIVTLDDGSAKASDVNEATFHCVETHFVCDPQTGKASAEANQATLDCLTDLDQ